MLWFSFFLAISSPFTYSIPRKKRSKVTSLVIRSSLPLTPTLPFPRLPLLMFHMYLMFHTAFTTTRKKDKMPTKKAYIKWTQNSSIKVLKHLLREKRKIMTILHFWYHFNKYFLFEYSAYLRVLFIFYITFSVYSCLSYTKSRKCRPTKMTEKMPNQRNWAVLTLSETKQIIPGGHKLAVTFWTFLSSMST